jgi:PadR family transcriptional regulator, regulatory protein PadR
MRERNRHGCGCYKERYNRWLEPSILYLLLGGKKHGYELMNNLPELGFVNNPVDPGAIYRTLRHMEDVKLVKSEWDTGGSGPAKRIYVITGNGKDHLKLWASELETRRNALDSFLQKIEKSVEEIDKK